MPLSALKHLFVLMMENRSFDHVFGLSGIQGRDARTMAPTTVWGLRGDDSQLDNKGHPQPITQDAPFAMVHDVPHEFEDVKAQLLGPGHDTTSYGSVPNTNSGFLAPVRAPAAPNWFDAIRAFTPDKLPVLHALAKEFVVCDQWFASMPGPTFPNRMFAHAASCAGYPDSPTKRMFVKNELFGYPFNRGHIFGRMRQKKIPWAIYVHDLIENMSVLMEGIHRSELRDYESDFGADILNVAYAPKYIFIEPKYDAIVGNYEIGNSMHPLNNVINGELLIKDVYEKLRASPLWGSSALVVVFDEHGGFYDHVPPPGAPAPADGHPDPEKFDFKTLGPRVPALIISPLIAKNLIDHTQYDHTSILRTLSEWLGLAPLTERDKHAQSFSHLFKLDIARQGTPLHLPDPPPIPESAMLEAAPSAMPERSAQPFVLAAAIAKAKELGPDSFDSIMKDLEGLNAESKPDLTNFQARTRTELFGTTTESASMEARPLPELNAEQLARAVEKYGSDDAAIAWYFGITRAELVDYRESLAASAP